MVGDVDTRIIIVFRNYISHCGYQGGKRHADCPRLWKKLAVTTLRSDLLNFRRARAKRLREMESETVEGLVSTETRRSLLLISPLVGNFPFLRVDIALYPTFPPTILEKYTIRF